jgi:phage terminase Nu1 subunit (DNA packaging protein)
MGLSINAFAKLAGVSQPAVSKAVKQGRVVLRAADRQVDTDDPTNRAYLQAQLDKRKAIAAKESTPSQKPANKPAAEKKPRATKRKHVAAAPLDDVELPPADELADAAGLDDVGASSEVDDMIDELGKITDAEKRASIRLKLSQARRHELKLEQDKGKLVAVELVERAAGKLHAEIRNRVQGLPRRMAPRLLAMAVAGSNEREIQELLEREIDDALEAVRAAAGELASV